MRKKKLYWTFQLGGWFLYGLIQVIGANIVATKKELLLIDYAPLILEAVFFLLATHGLRHIIVYRKWLLMSIVAIIPRVILLALLIGVLAFFFRVTLIYYIGSWQASLFSLGNIAGNSFANALLVFIWAVFYFIYHYFESYNKSLKYEAAIHEIELNNLKSQLNPHFMFNALNSIRAMVDDEPDKSKIAITQLSNILRNSLVTDKKKLTTFDQELTIVKDYLSLESIRYEERLKVNFQIAPESKRFSVPPLMIQTLVENGIKHGISKLKEGGVITIRSSVDNGSLRIQIKNSGHLKNVAVIKGTGFGIKNTLKRLDLIYGDQATFNIYNKNKEVITELTIPEEVQI